MDAFFAFLLSLSALVNLQKQHPPSSLVGHVDFMVLFNLGLYLLSRYNSRTITRHQDRMPNRKLC